MFEDAMGTAAEVDDLGPWPDRVPVFDTPDYPEVDWDAWQAELEADPGAVDPLDSDPDRVLSADELLARAATEPPLLSASTLALIAPNDLDDDGKLGLAAAWARVENAAVAGKLAAIGAFAGPAPRDDLAEAAFAWAEVSAALRLGDAQGGALVHTARTLDAQLPATRAAMAAGWLSPAHAQALVDGTATLHDAQCAELEARVLPHAADRTPALHRAA